MNQGQRRRFLLQALINERPEYQNTELPSGAEEQRQLLRGLMNLRAPQETDAEFLRIQDEYLQTETAAKGITDLKDLTPVQPGLYLWQGDITTLKCDAIVNAANSGMTGCYIPNHRCIDNAIHTYAGVQLRLECSGLMKRQGHKEEPGRAKITKAYNLPCRYVLHTIGPVIGDAVAVSDRRLLADCYRSCLDLAARHGLHSVAFCCISTGEFRFPNELAAQVAIQTVIQWQRENPNQIEVIFNVFKERDYDIYEKLLRADRKTQI